MSAVIVPVAVIFLKPEISELPSTTTTLLAVTVPADTSSIVSSSVSVIFALPIMKEPLAVMLPELDMALEFIVPKPETFPLVSKV